jgi:hypothetical protein
VRWASTRPRRSTVRSCAAFAAAVRSDRHRPLEGLDPVCHAVGDGPGAERQAEDQGSDREGAVTRLDRCCNAQVSHSPLWVSSRPDWRRRQLSCLFGPCGAARVRATACGGLARPAALADTGFHRETTPGGGRDRIAAVALRAAKAVDLPCNVSCGRAAGRRPVSRRGRRPLAHIVHLQQCERASHVFL